MTKIKKINITEEQFNNVFDKKRKIYEIMLPITFENPLTYLMCENGVINEGLIKTYPFDTMKRYVCQYFNIPLYYFHEYENNGIRCAAIDIYKDEHLVNMVDKAMNLCSYFKSQMMELDTLLRVHYEPKFEEKEEYDGEFLYHITEHMNIPRIRKIGLVPSRKNKRFNYGDRIYLFSSDVSKEDMYSFAEKLFLAHEKDFKDGLFCLLKVKNDGSFSLHKDPNSDNGFWTSDNIHPRCIMDDIDYFKV